MPRVSVLLSCVQGSFDAHATDAVSACLPPDGKPVIASCLTAAAHATNRQLSGDDR